MRKLQEIKDLLRKGEENTVLGMHINSLLGYHHTKHNATFQVEEAMEIMVQMEKNGIDVFKGEYKMGSVSKAYHQVELEKLSTYK